MLSVTHLPQYIYPDLQASLAYQLSSGSQLEPADTLSLLAVQDSWRGLNEKSPCFLSRTQLAAENYSGYNYVCSHFDVGMCGCIQPSKAMPAISMMILPKRRRIATKHCKV